MRSNTSDNNGSQELFSSLNKRIHQCEKKIEELQKTSKEHNTLSNEPKVTRINKMLYMLKCIN